MGHLTGDQPHRSFQQPPPTKPPLNLPAFLAVLCCTHSWQGLCWHCSGRNICTLEIKIWSFCHYCCQVMEMNVCKIKFFFFSTFILEAPPNIRLFFRPKAFRLLYFSRRFQQGCLFMFSTETQLTVSAVGILKNKLLKVRDLMICSDITDVLQPLLWLIIVVHYLNSTNSKPHGV